MATCMELYTVSQKNKTPNSCTKLQQLVTEFQNSFTVKLSRKFVKRHVAVATEAQQQIRRTPLLRLTDGTDLLTDRRMDGHRTVL